MCCVQCKEQWVTRVQRPESHLQIWRRSDQDDLVGGIGYFYVLLMDGETKAPKGNPWRHGRAGRQHTESLNLNLGPSREAHWMKH